MIFQFNSSYKTRLVTAMLFFVFSFVTKESMGLNASFTVVTSSGCNPLTVQFNNTSTGAVSYSWDFGNGNTSVVNSPSEIYTTPGNYTVKLVAYSAGGQADSMILTNAVTVSPPPVPSFTANVTSGCINSLISFINNSTLYDSLLWDFGDGFTSSQVNPTHAYSGTGSFSVTLICYNTSKGCSESLTLTNYINIAPPLSATVSVNVNSSCNLAQVFSFTAAAPGAASFSWNFGDNTTSTLQNPSHTYTATGIYDITLITTSSGGCKDTLFLDNYIELKSNLVPPMTFSDSSGCLPLLLNSSAYNFYASILWNFGDGGTSTAANATHLYTTQGVYPLTLTVTYANGCTNSNSYNGIITSVGADAQMTLSNTDGCNPLTIQCNNQSTNGTSYLWDFGDGSTSTAFNPSHTYTVAGSYYVTLEVSNANGCNDITPARGVFVRDPVAVIFADVTSGCPPLTVNFIGNPTAQTGYFWDFGDGNTSTSANPQHIYNSLGSYTVKLAVTNAYGCTDTSSYTVINVATPSSNFVPPTPVSGCAPMTVNLSDNTPGASTWLWNFGDGANATGQTVTHTYTVPGTYVVSVNSGSGTGGCPQSINNFSTFIIGGGIANFTYTNSPCPPYTAWFQDSSVNAVTWFWDFGDGTTSTQQNPVHIYAQPGVYNVSLTITTADGCVLTCIHNYALSFEPLIANAAAFTTDTVLPMTVNFTANSTGAIYWLWNFGDSTTSTLENPTHVYTQPGPYDISLTISNDSCTYTYNFGTTNIGAGGGTLSGTTDSIHAPPPRVGCAPMGVFFHNPFLNTTTWNWDFGDGLTSGQAHPIHFYTQVGSYDVTLYATHSNGDIDTLDQPGSVIVTGGVNADFNISYANSCTGTTVSLSAIANNISSYSWNFGDGTYSTLPNPVHTYPNTGSNYIISLSASDSVGCNNFMTKSFYVSTNMPLHASKTIACGSDSVYFESGNLIYSSYMWYFGDGDSSSFPNAYHQYGDTGIFYVTLVVTDSSGCTQLLTLPDPVEIYEPVPSFTDAYYPVCVGAHAIFTNTSTNADHYLWDFGDGTTSTAVGALHWYNPGSYTVTLTAYKNNCSKTYTLPYPVIGHNTTVDFSYTQDQDCLPVTITCQDLSNDVASWIWSFGDGTVSNVQNPVHTFYQVPSGPVELKITNAAGCQLLKTLPNISATMASFALSDSGGCAPVSISCQDSSTNAVSWFWDFGDGSTSIAQNPSHTYANGGIYDIQLIVHAASGCTDTMQLGSAVTVANVSADFSTNLTAGCAPAIIDFTDLSGGASSWEWDFGDGSNSLLQNPSHIYTTPGIYDIKLVVSSGGVCSDSMLVPAMIHVNGPITGFMASSSGDCAPTVIQFTDTSYHAVAWNWNFGDGSVSTAVNPQHIYTTPGIYSVSLNTEDSLGCQALFTYPYPVTVNASPVASFTVSDTTGCVPLNVQFTDSSSAYDSLFWDFGDGNTLTNSSSVNHTYTTAGVFYPFLVAFTNEGCTDTFHLSQPIITGLQPVAGFTSNVSSGCNPLNVSFNNLSTSTILTTSYHWDFGNGDTSNQFNPVYTYLQPGFYSVTLTVINSASCSDVTVKTDFIHVYDTLPPPASPILQVTVIDDASVEITWQNSPVNDLGTYELYRLNQSTGNYVLIYTDINPNSSSIIPVTTYTDQNLNTRQFTYTYKLKTTGLCSNALPLDSIIAHTTVNITAQTQGRAIDLSWTPYGGCDVNEYELYRSDPSSGNYLKIASLPAVQFTYTDTSLICPELYAYRVTATDLCGNVYASNSDTAMARPESPLEFQQVEVIRTTVVDDLNTLTEWKPPLVAPSQVVAYSIYRSETENGNYQLLANVGPNVFNYLDNHADVDRQEYYYKIEVVNICNAYTQLSNTGSSILLLGNAENGATRLVWTPYKGWDTGVSQYVIERQKSDGTWETIKIVNGSTLQAEDR